jgi:hypothetical protein
MALASPLPGVQGSRLFLGPDGGVQDTFLIVPGTSDYVTGGYAVTNVACRLKNIQTAWVTGGNSTAFPASGGWYPEIVFAFVQIGAVSTGAGVTGYSQFLFKLYVASTGVELASGGSVAGAIWQVTVTGY